MVDSVYYEYNDHRVQIYMNLHFFPINLYYIIGTYLYSIRYTIFVSLSYRDYKFGSYFILVRSF